MFGETGSNLPTWVTGVFCEPFSAASAIAGLLRSGFADHDIHAVGVLEGHAPAVSEFLLAIGLPNDVAAFYSDCFDDGAVLLMVRVDPARRKKETKIAIELLKHCGGVCAVANDNFASVSDSSPRSRPRTNHPANA
jgi:hypothetical protein